MRHPHLRADEPAGDVIKAEGLCLTVLMLAAVCGTGAALTVHGPSCAERAMARAQAATVRRTP
jgi:hypothetical protein